MRVEQVGELLLVGVVALVLAGDDERAHGELGSRSRASNVTTDAERGGKRRGIGGAHVGEEPLHARSVFSSGFGPNIAGSSASATAAEPSVSASVASTGLNSRAPSVTPGMVLHSTRPRTRSRREQRELLGDHPAERVADHHDGPRLVVERGGEPRHRDRLVDRAARHRTRARRPRRTRTRERRHDRVPERARRPDAVDEQQRRCVRRGRGTEPGCRASRAACRHR